MLFFIVVGLNYMHQATYDNVKFSPTSTSNELFYYENKIRSTPSTIHNIDYHTESITIKPYNS